ncbi:phosphoethanolamine transferase domain-containing protein [Sphaerotilus sp.]|uniref:phosphoethanolamine transferase domain-containing protein n=1 Tax=Sphaerotilus sp. TaxID=2093942 RepID=UPI0034E1AB5F
MLTQRTPQSPQRLAVLGSVWLSCVGQLPLWRALKHLPELSDGQAPVFIGSAMVLVAALFTLAFCMLAWPRVIRWALSLVLLGTAWSTQTTDGLDMPAMTQFIVLAGGPLAWLWSRPVLRQKDTWAQLVHNLGVAMAAAGVAAAVLILSVADFSWMWLQHAALLELLSPIHLWRLLGSIQTP